MPKTKVKFPERPAPVMLPLVNADRCDRHEYAQALVRLRLAFSGLDLCAHCYMQHAEALSAQGFTVEHDMREWIV